MENHKTHIIVHFKPRALTKKWNNTFENTIISVTAACMNCEEGLWKDFMTEKRDLIKKQWVLWKSYCEMLSHFDNHLCKRKRQFHDKKNMLMTVTEKKLKIRNL